MAHPVIDMDVFEQLIYMNDPVDVEFVKEITDLYRETAVEKLTLLHKLAYVRCREGQSACATRRQRALWLFHARN